MTILSTNPAQGSSNISLTAAIEVTFSQQINSASVDNASIVVTAKKPDIVKVKDKIPQPEGIFATDNFLESEYIGLVRGTVSVDGAKVIFTPSLPLLPDTTYSVTVSNAIVGADNTTLSSLTMFSFKTAEEDLALDILPVPETTSIIGSNVIFPDPDTAVTQTGFYVVSTNPAKDSFLISNKTIRIMFSKAIKDNTELSKIKAYTQELLSDEPAVEIDDYTVTRNSAIATITIGNDISLSNKIIIIKIDPDFAASDDSVINQEFVLSYVSSLAPYYSSTRIIRLKAGTVLTAIPDINIALNIWYFSNEVDEILEKFGFDEASKTILRKKYVMHSTLFSLLTNNFSFGLHDFIKKSLGEFDISVSNKSKVELYNGIIKEYRTFKRSWDNLLNFFGTKGIFVRSGNMRQPISIGRLWEPGLEQPGLNTRYPSIDRNVLAWDDIAYMGE